MVSFLYDTPFPFELRPGQTRSPGSRWFTQAGLDAVGDEGRPSSGRNERDETSFDARVAALRPHLRLQALKLCRGNEANAEDLVQVVTLKALEKEAQFQEGTKLHNWLATMLKTSFIDRLRKEKTRAGMGPAVDPEGIPAPTAEGPDPTDPLELFDTQDVLRLLPRLPAKQRLVFIEFHFNGKKHKDIHNEYGIPMGSIGAMLSRARAKLKSWLEAEAKERSL